MSAAAGISQPASSAPASAFCTRFVGKAREARAERQTRPLGETADSDVGVLSADREPGMLSWQESLHAVVAASGAPQHGDFPPESVVFADDADLNLHSKIIPTLRSSPPFPTQVL